ncbi:MAG: DciA family protein [Propionibacteriaceae bacterium]|nr:DciA family protein [Propionibacteriaceae bacterium]
MSEHAEAHDPTGLDLAAQIARATVQGKPYAPVAPEAPKVPKRRRFTGEQQRSGAHPDERDPQLIGHAFEKVVQRRGWTKRLSLSTVLRNWAELVGKANAEHSQPVDFRGGVLKVQCDSTAWATGMKYSASQLVAKLNRELGDRTVTRVDIVGPPQKSWKHGPRSVRDGRGPRDTYG